MQKIMFIIISFLFLISCGAAVDMPPDEAVSYTVTFNSMSGSSVDSKIVAGGTLLVLPVSPVRSGYNFSGWYKESSCINQWNSAVDKVNADITLFAKWVAVPIYTVSFNSQGGSAVNQQSVNSGSIAAVPVPPVRSGYNFTGWYKESGCINQWDFTVDTVITNTTLFARWTSYNVFAVSFNSQGGSAVNQQIIIEGSYASLPDSPVRAGYNFTGWYKESGCINQWNFVTDKVLAAITLYAKWNTVSATQIIVDHNSVAKFAIIPQFYIDEVKKMWFNLPGESHSYGYRRGLQLLAQQDSRFAVNVIESGNPEAYTSTHLRVSRSYRNQSNSWVYGTGESAWYAGSSSIVNTRSHINYCNTNNLTIGALGFGWCWDMTWNNDPGGAEDPVFKVRWAGSSDGGPQGNLRWGLDSADQSLTGNSICMDTYLNATQAYADYCAAQGYSTKVFFTTGPVDGYSGENGYQRQLKHDYIRNYVSANSARILFDYADILSWNDSGTENRMTWTDPYSGVHSYQMIHSDNMKDMSGGYAEDGDHIGERGALRLGKAVWYMMARMAGWDGVSTD